MFADATARWLFQQIFAGRRLLGIAHFVRNDNQRGGPQILRCLQEPYSYCSILIPSFLNPGRREIEELASVCVGSLGSKERSE
jgi:hypothetical protein